MKVMATEKLQFQRLVRMLIQLVAFAGRLPASAAPFVETIKSCTGKLAVLVGDFVFFTGQARNAENRKAKARSTLQGDLAAIGRAASAIAALKPGFDNLFKLPKAGDQKLLAAGHAFAKAAEEVFGELCQYGLRVTFIDDLKNDTQVFDKTMADLQEAQRLADESARKTREVLAEGLQAEIHLDAIVRNVLRDDAPALALWDAATVTRRSKSKRKEEAPVETPTAQPTTEPASTAATEAA